jgi:ubiquinone/menaquinone biosynthesis C-methylase UbiE
MQQEYRSIAQETWDAIAKSFDTTRQKPWAYCLQFIGSLKHTDIVADLGCGNGRHLLPCATQCSFVIGVDLSSQLLRITQKKFINKGINTAAVVHADIVQLPIETSSVDAVLFIASLHNIQGKENRAAALREVVRVLKPQGTALISVWSRWQEKYYKYFLKQLLLRTGEFGDVNVFWRQHNLNVPRFYHLYGKHEFRRELRQTGLHIERLESVKIHSKRFPDNYFAVVRKR